MRLAKIMAQGRHIMLMLDPTQQHNPQLHMETAAQLTTRSPCKAVQEAHAARVMVFLPPWRLHYTLLCLRKLRSSALCMPFVVRCATGSYLSSALCILFLKCAVYCLLPRMTLLQVAKRKLAQAHLWLVFKVVSAYQRQRQVCTDDLVQAGLYGLDKALDKFDPDRGNRLSTVAYMWIKEAVGRSYYELAGTIKIPERTRTNVGCLCCLTRHLQSLPEGSYMLLCGHVSFGLCGMD